MFHYFGTITNTRGDSLPGWQVECVQLSDGSTVVPIYALEDGTPISSVSGIANRSASDARGNFDFFVPIGTYSLKFYNQDGVFQWTQRYVSMYGSAAAEAIQAASSAGAAALSAEASRTAAEAALGAAQAATSNVSAALAAGTIGVLVDTRIYASKAALDADLVPADNLYALVVGDPTPANNDLYQKNGATTAGSWDGPLGIFASASAAANAAASAATSAAAAVAGLPFGQTITTPQLSYSFSTANGAFSYYAGGKYSGLLVPSGSTGQTAFVVTRFDTLPDLVGGETLTIELEVQRSATFTRTYDLGVFRFKTATSPVASYTFISSVIAGNTQRLTFSLAAEADDLAYGVYLQMNTAGATTSDEFYFVNQVKVRASGMTVGTDSDANLDAALQSTRQDLATLNIVGIARREVKVNPSPGQGEFAWIGDALDSITDASPDEPWDVLIEAKTGGYSEDQIFTKDDVNLIGVGADKPWIKFYQANSTDLTLVTANSALFAASRSDIKNLRITAQNGRYAVHSDDVAMSDKRLRFRYCEMEHLGNDEVIAYRGSSAGVWASLCALGMGTWGGFLFESMGCTYRSVNAPFLVHTTATNQARECELKLTANKFIPTVFTTAFQAQSLAMQKRCLIALVGNSFGGQGLYTRSTVDEIAFIGFGNTGLTWDTVNGVLPLSDVI